MLFKPPQKTESGFTLVEIAFVMVLAGLILAALIASYLRWNDILRSSTTRENIAIISDALSAYVVRNYRIPCPADPANGGPEPFGAEIGSGATGAILLPAGGCANLGVGETEGLVPFVTLGLDASIMRDGWGNYFTYQVNPEFTQDPETVTIPVHARCRTTAWLEGLVLVAGALDGGRNIAPKKARFCCIQIVNPANQNNIFSVAAPMNTFATIYNPDGAAWYADSETLADPYNALAPFVTTGSKSYYDPIIYGGTALASGHTDMPVYVLISHGKNGLGAFLGNGTINRALGALTSEFTNSTATNQNVYDLPHNSSNGNTYYDDIVSWQTQTDLFVRLRRDSCVVP